jgi:hypothetical protein
MLLWRGKRRIAFYDERSKSWVGNGRHPDGSRWRRQGFPDNESARSWAYKTRREGFNSRIQLIKSDARASRRFQNYRALILFHRGKLSLMPDPAAGSTHAIS